ncbi:Ig-like domain-containing protein [Gemmatimonas sp.]|uniref:Ig-like domain-containing protein n=1 Tax=Gemmatimonas sp. TaxID=1962908 RepID=UPI00286B0791|nr:Ig-like domain-containing protein [Gemmatimonas sp.]
MTRFSRLCMHAAMFAGGVLMLQACDDKIVAPVQPRIRSLEVFPSPATVRVEEDLVMVVKMAADSGADQSLTWRSSDPRRVSVTPSGIIRGVSVGPAVITVQSDADPTFSSAIAVSVLPRYTGVTAISASPLVMTLIPGQTQSIAATVTADPGVSRAVRYSMDNAAVATVSATGVVTAVAIGSTRLTVRSVVDTSAQTTVPITVRAPTGARVSIQAVTSRGTGLPVDLLNVQGQVDVLVNLEPGEAQLARLDLVVSNAGRDTVVASQSFNAAQAAQVFATGVSGSISAGVVVQSFRTDAFDSGIGTAYFRNGATTLRVVAVDITSSGTTQQSATSSVVAILNNPDGFIVQVRPLSTTGTPSALDAAGRRWVQAGRGLAVTTTPVMFSNRQLGARTISFPGNAPIATITTTNTGVSVDTLRLPSSFTSPNSSESYVNGQLPSVQASDAGGNLIPLVAPLAGGAGGGILNVQPSFTTGIRLEGLRIDNAPPPAATLVLTSTRGNSNNWVNGAYPFAEGLQNIAQDAGVGLRGSAGAITAQSAEVAFLAVGGELTDTTEVTTGSSLAASNSNLNYQLFARYSDRLGNAQLVMLSSSGAHPGTRFGVDLLPPTLRYSTGSLTSRTLISANSDSVFTSSTVGTGHRAFAVEAIDDRSGLPSGRVAVTLRRFAQPNPTSSFAGTYTCVVGTGTSCTPVFRNYDTTLPTDYRQTSVLVDDSTGIEGYYLFSATAQDQAGNVSEPLSKRALIDAGTGASAPAMTGLGPSGVLIGNEPAAFLALASDNVELRSGGLLLQYPNLPGTSQMLAYGTPSSGGTTFGVAFDTLLTSPIAGTHPAFTVPKFIRSMEMVDSLDRPPTGFGVTVKPNGANAWVTDFAFGGAPATLPANIVLVSGAVQSSPTSPVFAGNIGTLRELQTWRRAGASGLRFEAVGPSGQIAPPFTRVVIARLEPTSLGVNPEAWRVIGELTSPVGFDNGLRRVWSWDFGGLGSGSYVAIGVNAAGDGLLTRLVTP